MARSASHEARQIRLPCDHLRRRIPVRPFRLPGDGLNTGPGEALAAHADAVTNRAAGTEHVIENGIAGIDDDGALRLAGIEIDGGAAQSRRYRALFLARARHIIPGK